MKNGKLPKLDLNVTNRCNFQCVHCAFDSGCTRMSELSLEQIRKILQETKQLNGERFDITGGEPLLREDIADIIKIGKELGYKIELVTNGSLLTKEKLSLFRKLQLDSIAISLDGSNYKVYSKIRQIEKGVYKRVLENTKEAIKQGFPVKINTVAFQSNLQDIPKITEFCIKNNVKEHGIYYFTPVGRGKKSAELSIEPLEWLNFIRQHISKYSERIKISIEIPLVEKGKLNGEIGCIANAEKYHLQILPSGNVFPCAILASCNKPIANLSSLSIKDIWGNSKLWGEYWKSISKDFAGSCGYCVYFKKSFNMKSYDTKKFDFVCPLRKFKPGDIK